MGNVRIEINDAGVQELLRSPEIQASLNEVASKILERLGEGYGKDEYLGKRRCNVGIYPESDEAIRDCFENNTILKAVRG